MALVYSTETGRIKNTKIKKDELPSDMGDGIVRIHRENRKGSGVSLIKGLPMDILKSTAKKIKSTLGVGGSVKQGVIEIQSDQRDKIKALLETEGHVVKIAGA